MINLPIISITFTQLATSLIQRTANGTAVLIVKDSTSSGSDVSEYKDIAKALECKKDYKEESMQAIKDVMTYAVGKLIVVKTDEEEPDIGEALAKVEKKCKNCWVGIAGAETDETAALASWVKAKEADGKQYKAAVFNGTALDCKHIVNLKNESVVFKDKRGKQEGSAFIPALLGILASCNIKRGTTYYKCDTLESVAEPDDVNAAINGGGLVLINDEDIVRIGVGINSMTTTDGKNNTEDMRYIETVEAMDQIQLDIYSVFKNEYVGNYRNNLDNQMLFISAVRAYLKGLAEDDVLDKEYDNTLCIDVEAQRNAWLGTGKKEAEEWSEERVKAMTFKRSVFLSGDIKILGSMQDLHFNINLA
ncbi:MAG: phage tail sheath C-terminal domain-containing protein [Acetivibrio ethanolgignens]